MEFFAAQADAKIILSTASLYNRWIVDNSCDVPVNWQPLPYLNIFKKKLVHIRWGNRHCANLMSHLLFPPSQANFLLKRGGGWEYQTSEIALHLGLQRITQTVFDYWFSLINFLQFNQLQAIWRAGLVRAMLINRPQLNVTHQWKMTQS